MSRDKRFGIRLTFAEFYAIRNALRKAGDDDKLLATIEEQIEMLHAYFDRRWILHRSQKPYLELWRMR